MTNIEGLIYQPGFLTVEHASEIEQVIDRQPWLLDLKRRVQHYGYRYDYKARRVLPNAYIGKLPDWLRWFAERFVSEGVLSVVPDQAIVNEYQPGQGIAAHVDCVPCFGNEIGIVSLGSAAEMQFKHAQTGEVRELYLEVGSLLILKDEARFDWMHAIAARKSDFVDGLKFPRGRRLSLTFRKVILS